MKILKWFNKHVWISTALFFTLMVGIAWAADTKLSALTELATAPAGSDELYINDGGTSKKITVTNLQSSLESGTSNDIDPDRLSGDTTDDNLIDVAILGSFSTINITSKPASNLLYGGIILKDWEAGADIAQFDVVILDDTSGEWIVADADLAGAWESGAFGLAVGCSGGGGWPCQNGEDMEVLKEGTVRYDTWAWTGEGLRLWLGDGGTGSTLVELASIPNTANDGNCSMGHTIDTDKIYFDPSGDCTTVQ